MTSPSGNPIDIIATAILFDAKEAIVTLKKWSGEVDGATAKTRMLKELISATAKQMNGDLKAATAAVQKFAGALNVNPQVFKAIGKDLQVMDKLAQSALGGMNQKTMEASARMALLSSAIQKMSTKGKVSIDQVTSSLRTLNSPTSSFKFGKLGFSDTEITKAGEAAKLAATNVEKVGKAGKKAGEETNSGMSRAITGVNALRIALGVLVSMLIFTVIQAITTVFQGAIKQAREFEATLYRISNAERQLSMAGIEVSVKELKKGIQDIKDALPIFSKEDIAQLVGSVATTTKELGYTGDEILKLSAAIGILNINSTETETLLQTQAKVTNSLVSPQAKSIGNLGLSFGKAKLEAKAFEMQILKAGESFTDLTEKQKQEIKFQIVLETAGIDGIPIEKLREEIQKAGGDFQALDKYLESNDAKLQANKAAWNDLLTTIGQMILPLIPLVTTFFKLLNGGFIVIKLTMVEFTAVQQTLATVMGMFLSGSIGSIQELKNAFAEAYDFFQTKNINALFKEVPEDAPDWFTKEYAPKIEQAAETATGAFEDMYDAAEDSEDAADALAEIEEKIQDIILDAKQAQEDLDLKFEQKKADLDTEYNRKNEDAARDYGEKIVDINQDARDKVEDANRKSREDEKKAEQDLLQKLKELRQRFLMDLEDALHARDARQILRLIKEYNFEKQNILDRKKLDDKQRKDKLADELRDIEIDRKRKLEDAKIEYKRKLADLTLAKGRELAELALWHLREQQDIQRNVEQKLEKLLNGYITEGQIHEEQLSAIDEILRRHFGGQMAMIDQVVAYAQSRFAEMAALSLAGITGGAMGTYTGYSQGGGLASTGYSVGGGLSSSSGGRGGRTSTRTGRVPSFADGGTLIARQPTLALFGEKSPEIAQFTPINQLRGGSGGGSFEGGMGGGELVLGINLSPDLEARITRNTMEKTGKIVTKITRQK